jgi:ketosteroid isomerase-like protein
MPLSMPLSPLEVAERLFAAIAAGDIDAVAALYHPDIAVWHNSDGMEQTAQDNLLILRWVARNIGELRYEDVRWSETPSGFVQQHVMRGVAPSGTPIEVPACIVATVENGKITRLDEYLDAAHTAPLRG